MKKLLLTGLCGALLLVAVPVLAQVRSANFTKGDRVVVVATINVRDNANGAVVGKQYAGASGTLSGGPIVTAGYTWWKVDYDSGVDGWSAEDYMQKPSVAIVAPKSNTDLAAGAAYAGTTQSASIGADSSIVTTSNLNVRSTPNGVLVATIDSGSAGTVLSGPQSAGGNTWFQIKYSTGATGWSVADYIKLK